jgi:hypothetical protein
MKLPQKYRPMDVSKKYKLKYLLETGRRESYNWRSRVRWYPAGYKFNRKTIFKQFGKLHYLACHSPEPITKKWQAAYNNFHKKHFGSCKASVRYLNKWSCHNWL